MGQILNENLDFRDQLSTFGAENTPTSWPFKTEKNAQSLPKQLPNNFEKVQNATFSTSKIVKNDPVKSQKGVNSSSKPGKSQKNHRTKKIDFFIFLSILEYNFTIFS